MKDIIRSGVFQDSECERVRRAIVDLDCGFNADAIEYANSQLQDVTDVNLAREILADCLDNAYSEIVY